MRFLFVPPAQLLTGKHLDPHLLCSYAVSPSNQTLQHNILYDSNLRQHCCENDKSCLQMMCMQQWHNFMYHPSRCLDRLRTSKVKVSSEIVTATAYKLCATVQGYVIRLGCHSPSSLLYHLT